MNRRRKFYGRKPSADLGFAFKEWRKAKKLSLHKAATELGIDCRSPGSYLWQMEEGKKTVPEMILLKAATVYGISIEEVFKEAYPHQLMFPELISIVKSTAPSEEIEKYLRELEEQLEKEDKQELASYATFLVIRRKTTVKS